MTAAIPGDMYPTLLRKFAWDLLPCNRVQKFMPILNVVPASAEGAEIEHVESHKRIALQDGLQDVIPVFAAMSGQVLAALALGLDLSRSPKRSWAW